MFIVPALSLYTAKAAEPVVQLWAVSDGVRVNPVSGKLIEARPDVHADYPTTDPRQGSAVWEPSTRTVPIKAARNEFVAFQIVIDTDKPLEEIDVSFDVLTHPEGARIEGRNLAIFKEWYVHVRRPSTGYEETSLGAGWYPDALMPQRRSSLRPGFPFSIPDRYNNIPGQTNQAIWIDVFVPSDAAKAPPGRYSGEVQVRWKGGSDSVKIALDVWNFALPDQNHLRGDVWNHSLSRMSIADELRYYQMAKRHRFLPLVYAYRPKIQIEGAKVTLDWSEYDRRIGPYLDGSAFSKKHGYWGPGNGRPVSHVMLPFNIHKGHNAAWPVQLPSEGRTPEYEALWKETARQVREHLDSNPAWRKVEKIAFLNGLDESYSEEAYEKMIYYGRLLHEAMGRDWFRYRIDGGYSLEAMKKLSREVDLWVCHTVDYDKKFADSLLPKGVQTWFYGPMIYERYSNSGCGSNTFLDLDLLVNRGIGWVGWKYQTGWVEWEFDWNAHAAWYEAENFKDDHRVYNGSGQMIYRGAVMGYSEPIPSIRLKAMRRGLQDYEYFWLLSERQGKQAADRLVDAVIYKKPFGADSIQDTEIWKNNPEVWSRARDEAGAQIASPRR